MGTGYGSRLLYDGTDELAFTPSMMSESFHLGAKRVFVGAVPKGIIAEVLD